MQTTSRGDDSPQLSPVAEVVKVRVSLVINDVTCPKCMERVKEALSSLGGREVKMELLPQGRAYVRLTLSEVSAERVTEALKRASQGTKHNYVLAEFKVED